MFQNLHVPRRITRGNKSVVGLRSIEDQIDSLSDLTRIGNSNIFRRLKHLSIGQGSYILNANHVFGATYADYPLGLQSGRGGGIMRLHLFDFSGETYREDGEVMAGSDTLCRNQNALRHVNVTATALSIGARCYLGVRGTQVACSIFDEWIATAGSEVVHEFDPESAPCLIAGNPARIVKRYPKQEEFEPAQ